MKVLVVMALAALVWVVWYVAYRNRKAARLGWEDVASAGGLVYFPGARRACPVMRGRRHGVDVRLTAEDGGRPGGPYVITRVVGFFESTLPAGLFVARQGSLGALERVFGIGRLEIGDPEFDRVLLIKGADTDEVFRLLASEQTRTELMQFFERYPTTQVTQTTVTMVLPQVIDTRNDLESVLADLGDVVDLFTAASLQDESRGAAEGRRSSVPTVPPEVRYSQPPLVSLFEADMSLKGEARDSPSSGDRSDG
jgi:hypothetical protein